MVKGVSGRISQRRWHGNETGTKKQGVSKEKKKGGEREEKSETVGRVFRLNVESNAEWWTLLWRVDIFKVLPLSPNSRT